MKLDFELLAALLFAAGAGWALGQTSYFSGGVLALCAACCLADFSRSYRHTLRAASAWRKQRWDELKRLERDYIAAEQKLFFEDTAAQSRGLSELENRLRSATDRAEKEVTERFGPVV